MDENTEITVATKAKAVVVKYWKPVAVGAAALAAATLAVVAYKNFTSDDFDFEIDGDAVDVTPAASGE